MAYHDFSQLNTSLSVREQTFLSRQDLMNLLQAGDEAQVSLLLEGTPYALSVAELGQHHAIEAVIMQALAAEYDFAYRQSPDQDLINVFGLKYVYHNLKVYLKMRAVGRDLTDLLIPIGPYDLDALKHASLTLESDQVAPLICEELTQTWSDYQDYQNTVAIDMGMDSAYFRHLRQLASQTRFPLLSQLVDAKIDFFNAITALRAMEQQKPNSFAYQLMSRKGTLSAQEMLSLVKSHDLAHWFNQLNALPYCLDFDAYVDAMRKGTIQARQLETLQDLYLTRLVQSTQLQSLEAGQILRYLNGREMEALNLRLILLGRANGLAKEVIINRLRVGYDDK